MFVSSSSEIEAYSFSILRLPPNCKIHPPANILVDTIGVTGVSFSRPEEKGICKVCFLRINRPKNDRNFNCQPILYRINCIKDEQPSVIPANTRRDKEPIKNSMGICTMTKLLVKYPGNIPIYIYINAPDKGGLLHLKTDTKVEY